MILIDDYRIREVIIAYKVGSDSVRASLEIPELGHAGGIGYFIRNERTSPAQDHPHSLERGLDSCFKDDDRELQSLIGSRSARWCSRSISEQARGQDERNHNR